MQSSMGRYLELSMQLFVEQQHRFTDQLKHLLGQAQQPIQILREMADQQMPIWRLVRREFFRNLSRARVLKARATERSKPGKPFAGFLFGP